MRFFSVFTSHRDADNVENVSKPNSISIKSATLWLFFIILTGFLIRIIGITYDLPAVYHTDEPYLVKNALWMGAHRSLKPFFYTYPTLYSYLLLIAYGIYFLLGNILGAFRDALDFGVQFIVNPTNFYLIGRCISVAFGTATGILVYFLGKDSYDSQKIGLLSALFLMVSYAHKFHSQTAVPDVTMIFFATLAMIFIIKIPSGEWKTYLFAGLFAGFSISTKYNSGFLVVAILVAHIIALRQQNQFKIPNIILNKKLGLAYGACLVAFFVASPYWILDVGGYIQEFRNITAHMSSGHLGETEGIPWLWVITSAAQRELLLGVFYFVGLGYALYKRKSSDIIFLGFILPTFLYVGSWEKKGLDYLYPIFPVLAILAARVLISISSKTNTLQKLAYLIIFLVVIPTGIKSSWHTFKMTRKDTRTIAQEWIEGNIPSGTRIGFDWYTFCPNLFDPTKYTDDSGISGEVGNQELINRINQKMGDRRTYHLIPIFEHEDSTIWEGIPPDIISEWRDNSYVKEIFSIRCKSVSELKKEGVEYVMISSFSYEMPEPSRGKPIYYFYKRREKTYNEIMKNAHLEKKIPSRPSHLGPTIKIYSL